MSNRDHILSAIKASQPALRPLPILDYSVVPVMADLLTSFAHFVNMVGGQVRLLDDLSMLNEELEAEQKQGRLLINRIGDPAKMDEVSQNAVALEAVDRAYIKGSIGVAENGAIWVNETAMGNRILPFICQELVILIEADKLVATMHDAYREIQINQEGFGVFIAGPSKTADIEQSLVIGAHGPVALTVLVLTHG
ncbi:LutC/YkgG family protein [Flavihumibacter sp. UBA7668]|uniref:LutC/YkgG family protein n=1 Tax=Flavihumibacter sp. UBA7668 TaxID=1946542 RepID=UPI0025C51F02|nr:LUD domain-containing protein [Flavihumibacter sp. UBA7668]